MTLTAAPGAHVVHFGGANISGEYAAGASVYLRADVSAVLASPKLELVSPAEARDQMTKDRTATNNPDRTYATQCVGVSSQTKKGASR